MAIRTRILGAASYFPSRQLHNSDLEKMVETNDQWIVERTGIRTRRIVEPGTGASALAEPAVRSLLAKVGRSPEDLDAILVATVTPDQPVPSCACLLQARLGAKQAWAMDINAACSGFLYALSTADQFIQTGRYRRIVVVGVDVMSSILDYQDRSTCILFGDGAAAVYLEGDSNSSNGIVDTVLHADGTGAGLLYMKGGGSIHPASHQSVEERLHYVRQEGAQVFKFAVTCMANVVDEVLQRNQMRPDQIDYFVAHQANIRIIEATGKRLGLKPEQVVINIERYGNTTAATIPSCLAEAADDGRLKPGKTVLLAAFGAGFTWGASLLRWG